MESIRKLLHSAQPACTASLGDVEELIVASQSLAVQAAQLAAVALKTFQKAAAGSRDPQVMAAGLQLRDLLLWRVFSVNGGMVIDKGHRPKESVLASLSCTCDPFDSSVDQTLPQLVQAHGKIQQGLLKQLICSSNLGLALKDIKRNADNVDRPENAAALQILKAFAQDEAAMRTTFNEVSRPRKQPSPAASSPDQSIRINVKMPMPEVQNTFLHFTVEADTGHRRRCVSEGPQTRSKPKSAAQRTTQHLTTSG